MQNAIHQYTIDPNYRESWDDEDVETSSTDLMNSTNFSGGTVFTSNFTILLGSGSIYSGFHDFRTGYMVLLASINASSTAGETVAFAT